MAPSSLVKNYPKCGKSGRNLSLIVLRHTFVVAVVFCAAVVSSQSGKMLFKVGGARLTDVVGGMLQPRESESRQIQYLNGMWNFRADQSPDRVQGLTERWYLKSLVEVSCRLSTTALSTMGRSEVGGFT